MVFLRSSSVVAALAVGVAVGCSAAPVEGETEEEGESSEDALESRDCPAGDLLDEAQVVTLMARAGMPREQFPRLVCAVKYESSFCRTAVNQNGNQSRDRGLFQINDIHLSDRERGKAGTPGCPTVAEADRGALFDPVINTRCAAAVYRLQGLAAWYGYRNHQGTCDAYRLSPAAAAAAANAPAGGTATSDVPLDPRDPSVGAPGQGPNCRCDGFVCVCR